MTLQFIHARPSHGPLRVKARNDTKTVSKAMMMVKTPKSGERIEDLVDFYQQWADLRDVAMNMSRDGRLDQKERVILQWMVRVVDRVGPVDLK